MRDVLRRRGPVLVAVGSYVLLGVLVVRALVGGARAVEFVFCGVVAVLLVLRKVLPAQVFVGALVAVTLVLAVSDSWFGFFTPVCYYYAYRIAAWPAELAYVAGAAVAAGVAQADGVRPPIAYAAVLVVNVAPMTGLAWLLRVADRREREREAALDEAWAANVRLAAALRENAELHDQLLVQARTAGVLDERRRMAREIHDTLAQGLIGIVTQLQAAEVVAGDPEQWRRHHDSATTLARESLAEARRSVHALRPEPLETARLDDALAAVARRWSERHGVPVAFASHGDYEEMAPEAEEALLRTAQEALANVARHAAADRVGITLSYQDHDVALDVHDDGRGFDPSSGAAGSFGLIAMRQRIEDLSGTLRIESVPGTGTGIKACLPRP